MNATVFGPTNEGLDICPCECTCGPSCDHRTCPCKDCVAARAPVEPGEGDRTIGSYDPLVHSPEALEKRDRINAYEAKKAARIERLRARADRLARVGQARVDRAHAMASVIPFGQPIMVGHYSEGRDRRYRGRIESNFRKGFETMTAAKDLAARADAAEDNTSISSDDPDAVDKLREKLAGMKAQQDARKKVNATIRKAQRAGKKDGVPWEPLAVAEMVADGLPEGRAAELVKPDFMGRVGFPSYSLSNLSANIRRVEERIGQLAARAEAPEKAPETIGEATLEEADNRIRVRFPGKPSEDVRRRLKSAGFRWSPSEGAWQRMPTAWAWELARQIARELLPRESLGAADDGKATSR